MKFRMLVMCFLAGIIMLAYPSINTYAAEDGIIATDGNITGTEITDANTNNETAGNLSDTAVTQATDSNTTDVTTENTIDADADEAAVDNTDAEEEVEETVEVDDDSENTEESSDNSKVTTEDKTEKKVVKKIKYKKSELRLLSALIYCEAGGESYQGKLAVGIVVMNRKRSGSYPDTVKGVIYQKYQFGPVNNGTLENALAEYDDGDFTSENEKECIQAAKAALSGTKSITVNGSKKDFSKYLFFSGSLSNATFSLGNHDFK